jgi:hypothetical protein
VFDPFADNMKTIFDPFAASATAAAASAAATTKAFIGNLGPTLRHAVSLENEQPTAEEASDYRKRLQARFGNIGPLDTRGVTGFSTATDDELPFSSASSASARGRSGAPVPASPTSAGGRANTSRAPTARLVADATALEQVQVHTLFGRSAIPKQIHEGLVNTQPVGLAANSSVSGSDAASVGIGAAAVQGTVQISAPISTSAAPTPSLPMAAGLVVKPAKEPDKDAEDPFALFESSFFA